MRGRIRDVKTGGSIMTEIDVFFFFPADSEVIYTRCYNVTNKYTAERAHFSTLVFTEKKEKTKRLMNAQ